MNKRLKFFTAHLAISIALALIIITWVFVIWYPSPLAQATSVTDIFLMMVAIDVTLGPLLGLIVYKAKKTLKTDLTVIVLIQLSALCYGIYSIAQGRPVWIAYNVDRFELVRNNEIYKEKIQQAMPQYRHPSWLRPQYVAVQFAKDNKQFNDDMFAEVLRGVSLAQRPERYVPLAQAKQQMQQRAQELDKLENYNSKEHVQETLSKYPQANAWLPLKATAVDMVVLIDKDTAQILEIVDLRPWN